MEATSIVARPAPTRAPRTVTPLQAGSSTIRPVVVVPEAGIALVPLRTVGQDEIGSYAVIDAADAEWVGRWNWHLTTNGYAARSTHVDGKSRTIRLHRALLGLGPISKDPRHIDHIDRDRLNCQRANLRVATKLENAQNLPSYDGAASRHRGVSWDRRAGKWKARIKINGKERFIGHFDSEEAAGAAARSARQEAMPYAAD